MSLYDEMGENAGDEVAVDAGDEEAVGEDDRGKSFNSA